MDGALTEAVKDSTGRAGEYEKHVPVWHWSVTFESERHRPETVRGTDAGWAVSTVARRAVEEAAKAKATRNHYQAVVVVLERA